MCAGSVFPRAVGKVIGNRGSGVANIGNTGVFVIVGLRYGPI